MTYETENPTKEQIDCKHEFILDDIIIDTLPPMCHAKCKKCGFITHIIVGDN